MQSTVWSERAARCLSKSYIMLPITVFPVEIATDIPIDGHLQRHKASVIAGLLQSFDSRLGKVLVLPADGFGHLDIVDIGRSTKRFEHRRNHVAETLRFPGPHVENSIVCPRLEHPAQHGYGIVDENEIAPLLSVGNTFTIRFEEF